MIQHVQVAADMGYVVADDFTVPVMVAQCLLLTVREQVLVSVAACGFDLVGVGLVTVQE
jgi:hypothetical protein